MKIAVLLAIGFSCLLMVHHVSAQWDERESPAIKDNFPHKTFYVSQRLTDYWQINYPCTVSKGIPAPNVHWIWFRNGIYEGKINSRKDEDRILNDTRLSLKYIREDETYQCVAENKYGTALSRKINIRKSEFTIFDIKNQDKPYEITKNVGDSLAVQCTRLKDGSPVGTFYWVKEKKRIKEDERVYVNEEGSLIFTYLNPNDAGSYVCQNTNPNLVTTTGGGWTEITVLGTQTPQQVPIEPLYMTKNLIAIYGDDFKIQCMYGGIPIPEVKWRAPITIRTPTPDHTLELKDVNEENEGSYYCKGTNRDQTTSEYKFVIDVKGPPLWVRKSDPVMIVPEGSDVVFHCEARPLKGERKLNRPKWMRNARDLMISPGGVKGRLSLSVDGTALTFSSVQKSTDICNFQCSYSNDYGEIFTDISFNVILKTMILVAPKDQMISRGDVAIFPIDFKVDPLVKKKVKLTWKLNGNEIDPFDIDGLEIMQNWTLVVNTSQMDEDRFKTFLANYSIVIDNSVETVIKFALLTQNPATGGTTMQSAGLDAKWIALIVALVLFFIIFILLLCILFNRQSGDDYSVDKKERKAGHDPEKELADGGFHDLPRTDDDPGLKKPDNLSISSTGKSIASDTDSMGEYSDNDAGSRFNEDGSFIGAYQSHESKGNESNV